MKKLVNGVMVEMSSDEALVREAEEVGGEARHSEVFAKEEEKRLKMAGIKFTDVTGANPAPLMLSAMPEDQWGLESVRRKVLDGLDIRYEFKNGTKLVLNSANFDNVEAVWLPFRASFF